MQRSLQKGTSSACLLQLGILRSQASALLLKLKALLSICVKAQHGRQGHLLNCFGQKVPKGGFNQLCPLLCEACLHAEYSMGCLGMNMHWERTSLFSSRRFSITTKPGTAFVAHANDGLSSRVVGKSKPVHSGEGGVDLECGVTRWGGDIRQRKPGTPLLGSRTTHECVPAVRKESLYVVQLPSLVCMH